MLSLLSSARLGDATSGRWTGAGDAAETDLAVVAATRRGLDPRALAEQRERVGATGLVVVASSTAGAAVRRLLGAGVRALVELDRLDETLLLAVQAACAGQVLLPESVGWALTRPSLSNREKQILAMVVLGLSNREIADKLVVAESTVKTHLVSTFRKLDVRSRREAVALILDPQQGLGTGILAISDS